MRVRLALDLRVARGDEVLNDALRLSGRLGQVVRLDAAQVLDNALEERGREWEVRQDLLREGRVVRQVLTELEREDVLRKVDDVLVRFVRELVDSGRVE